MGTVGLHQRYSFLTGIGLSLSGFLYPSCLFGSLYGKGKRSAREKAQERTRTVIEHHLGEEMKQPSSTHRMVSRLLAFTRMLT